MAYLYPPPEPAPVVVIRDTGGLVADYKRQTEIYRSQGREVRLHECRSACTLALSLPNVCVYPHSVLRFHQAYNRDTREIDHRISDELFSAYPQPVRQRLGYLTRKYKSLSGEELIALGVRNCNESPVLHARRQQRGASQVAQAAPSPATPGLMARMGAAVGSMFAAPAHSPSPPVQTAMAPPSPKISMKATSVIPLPPPRPILETDATPVAVIAAAQAPADASKQDQTQGAAPLPPRRPAQWASHGTMRAQLPRLITGAYPVLPAGLTAYAPLR